MLWQNLKAPEFPEAVKKSKGVCVIPIGAMEKHGPHMPVGTDNIIAERTAILAAELEPVVVFPTFDFGHVNGLQHFDGTIAFSNNLLLDFLSELCSEIARSGFKKIFFLNAHGGNPSLLTTLCNRTKESKKDYVVICADSYMTTEETMLKEFCNNRGNYPDITDEDVEVLERYVKERTAWGHADFDEMMLVHDADPGLVDETIMKNESGESTHRADHLREFSIYSAANLWFINYPNSFAGTHFPHLNPRLSAAYTKHRVEYIAKLYRAVKDDTVLLEENEKWNKMW